MSTEEHPARFLRRLVVAVGAVGAALRLAMLAWKWDRPLLLNDSWWYGAQAQQLGKGHFFPEFLGVSGAEHAPFTSIVLAPGALLDPSISWQRATNTLLGIAAVFLLGWLAHRIAGARAGLIATAIAALYPNIWMSDALIMSETLALLLVTLALHLAWTFRIDRRPRVAIALGVVLGLGVLTRSELMVLVPFLAFAGARGRPRGEWLRAAGLVVATSVAVLLPWLVFNATRFDRPVLMSTNDGTTLLGSNCPLTYSGSNLGGWSLRCLDQVGDVDGDASVRSAEQRSAAFSYARQDISRLPLVAVARLGRAVDLFGVSESVRADLGEERPRWAVWLGIGCWWLLAPMAAIGMRRLYRAHGLFLVAPAVAVLATTVLFYGSHRLRAPLEPLVVLGAAVFLAGLGGKGRAPDVEPALAE